MIFRNKVLILIQRLLLGGSMSMSVLGGCKHYVSLIPKKIQTQAVFNSL